MNREQIIREIVSLTDPTNADRFRNYLTTPPNADLESRVVLMREEATHRPDLGKPVNFRQPARAGRAITPTPQNV